MIADFSPRNLERLETFKEIAQKTNRELVVTAKDAYLLHVLASADGVCRTDYRLKEKSKLDAIWQELQRQLDAKGLVVREGSTKIRGGSFEMLNPSYQIDFNLRDTTPKIKH